VVFGNIAQPLQEIEDGLARPGASVNVDSAAAGKDAGDVPGEPSTGDVGGTFEQFCSVESLNWSKVGFVDFKKLVSEATGEFGFREQFSHQRITVRVK